MEYDIIEINGAYSLCKKGTKILSQEDGPIVMANGDKLWFKQGILHREDGPAIERFKGDWGWYYNGQCHREDGPAVGYINGDVYWYQEGKLHRLDGPALERSNGAKSWHYRGKLINCSSQEEFQRLLRLRAFW